MITYKSKGTVRYKVGKGSDRFVFFVPDSDFSIKDADKHYAVFATSACDCASASCGSAFVVKYDPKGNCGVKIGIDKEDKGWGQILSDAARCQAKVEILVKVKKLRMTELVAAEEAVTKEATKKAKKAAKKLKKCLKLVGITFPVK